MEIPYCCTLQNKVRPKNGDVMPTYHCPTKLNQKLSVEPSKLCCKPLLYTAIRLDIFIP